MFVCLSHEINSKPVGSIIFQKNNDFSILGTKGVLLLKKKIKNILTNLSSIWSNASLKWHQNYNNQSFFLAKYDVFRSKQQYSKYLLTEIQNNIKKTKKSRSKILYIKPITCYLVKKSEKPERCFKNKKIWVVCETWQSFSDSIRWGAV